MLVEAARGAMGMARTSSLTATPVAPRTIADCRVAGETTVTNSRINAPKARITGADRPATLCTGAKPARFNKICY